MGSVLKRRGLLAGAAALLGAGAAKLTGPGHAEAAHTAPEDVLHADVVNTTTGETEILHTGGTTRALYVRSTGASATFQATGGRTGARGVSTGIGGVGVEGVVSNGLSFGVYGYTESATTNATGVRGDAFAGATVGVWGRSTSSTAGATGTRGEATAPAGATTGVLGRVSSPAGIAVRGIGGSGVGVFGGSDGNIGVYADSASSTAVFATSPARGVWGRTTAGIGVVAQATAGGTVQNRSYGLYAAAPAPGWAGYFEGNVYVTGQVIQAGAAASTATAADGSTRAVYSVDSAEPLVEDVGEAKLVGGRAEVQIDPDFAAVADGGAYHVFLTPKGDCNGLYVASQTPAGFEVRELKGGAAALAFSYRVVAKRKDASGKRLERLERPKGLDGKDLEPPKLPEAVALPEKPASESKPERREAP